MARNYSAKAVVADFVQVSEKRLLALSRQSIQDLTEKASVPTAKGGLMRVDTGFLRNSGVAKLNGMPSGPSTGELTGKGVYDDGNKPLGASIISALSNMKLGDVFNFGWTANYARYREAYDGFLEAAVQDWPQIVAHNTAIIKERIKK